MNKIIIKIINNYKYFMNASDKKNKNNDMTLSKFNSIK